MITVLHVRASSGLAGPERWLLEAAEPLAREGFALAAALLVRPRAGATASHPLAAEAAARGLALAELADPDRRGAAATAAAVELARGSGAALLHAHDAKANWVALRAARRLRRPAVATVHLHTRATLALRLYRHLDRALLFRFAAVLAVAPAVARELAPRLRPERLHLVANGLDLARLVRRAEAERGAAVERLAREGPGPWIVGAGRLTRQKGFDLLLDALARGAGRLAGARLALAGEGPLRGELERRSAELGLRGRVLFLGERRDLAGYLAAADLVALPSRSEGSPYVALEALALARPLVAAAAGGLADLVGENDAGWRVAVGDVAALAAALAAALDDPGEAAARAGRGQRRVETEHGAGTMAARVAAIYRQVLAARRES